VSNLPNSAIRESHGAEAPDASERPTSVLVVGVGGQGVLMISRVLAEVCARRGLQVKQSEVHGMAQRGGTVFSHVRFGERVWSPTIPRGEADVVVALEWAEGLRWLSYLRPERGTFLADTRRIVPPFACRDRRLGARNRYPDCSVDEVKGRVGQSIALDAMGMAEELGNPRAANTVLLGALSSVLDFPAEEWRSAIDASVPPHSIEVNRAAFEHGRNWAQNPEGPDADAVAAGSQAERVAETTQVPVTSARVKLEITAAWCKGCDICVKVCPERCLALDAKRIVVITDPQACTGCRVCEWLCPDFAIRVRPAAVSVQAAS
jgi:indolepyruvate ferredoxin oxidoreductase beta subunit